ncbi:alcohol dehydrogenase [Pullulanibacillus camelliae]|uniref:Alcohol dehydrogenase n=1 Tax=Pullulanibacillus camelliae TaxID=1707096 RepID=A0A8J2YEY4_9BACL|nr:alcohol dehydrogenase catalytic domain-containing protein [Pullulanibacillus camelliae]GGE27778.1 alcohol dehydrogenase [Pullulanibacillus camelliae]
MKAIHFLGNKEIEYVEKQIPNNLGEKEVLVKVECCGLCGSDKRLFYQGSKYIPGHEISGVIYSVGAKVTIQKGTRVIIYIPLFCGKCKFCLNGENNRCQEISGLIGWQRDGGYAEYVRVPESNVIPIPDDISNTDGVLLLDTIGTAAHGIRLAMQRNSSQTSSDNVLVIGCGPLGLGAILTLQAFGFKKVYASDPSKERIELAKEFNAIPYSKNDSSIAAEFSIVIEASGSALGRKTGIYAVEPGGAFVVMGESSEPFIVEPTPELRRKDFYLIRSFYFQLNEVKDNIELYRRHQTSFQRLVSKVSPFEKFKETFDEFCEGKTVKPFVKMNG